MNNAQRINQDSGNVNWYTDQRIIEAAREVMGGIDLDPASDVTGNARVRANYYFDEQGDGLSKPWTGRVWMNHPFSRPENPCKSNCRKKICKDRGHHVSEYQPGNEDWINNLVYEYLLGEVTEACCITFAATSEAWFQPLAHYPQCYLSPRTNYYDGGGNRVRGVTKGSVVTYLGPNVHKFAEVFRQFGTIKIDYFANK